MRISYLDFGTNNLHPRDWFSFEDLSNKPLDLDIGAYSYHALGDGTPWSELYKHDAPDTYIVCSVPQYKDYRGYCETRYGTYNPVIFLSHSKIASQFKLLRYIFARWILKHEFGHAKGLDHCGNPFCIMRVPNISFGRFCKRCTKDLSR